MFTPLDNQPQLLALAAGVVTEYTEQDEVLNADMFFFSSFYLYLELGYRFGHLWGY